MSHGLRVWDASGNLTLDITDHLSRVLYHAVVSADNEGSTTIDVPAGGYVVPCSQLVSATFQPWVAPHKVTLSGTTLSWERAKNTLGNYVSQTGPSLVLVIAYG